MCEVSGLRAYSRVCMWQRCFVRTDLFAVGEMAHANSDSWAPLLAVLTLECAAKPT